MARLDGHDTDLRPTPEMLLAGIGDTGDDFSGIGGRGWPRFWDSSDRPLSLTE
jgi:hypothetical protein